MNENGLLLGVAAVLMGITVLMLVSGLVVSPIFLLVALPFGGAAYFIWYHASGRLAERVRENPRAYTRSQRGGDAPGSFGAGAGSGGRFTRERTRQNRRSARSADPTATDGSPRLTRREAARILGVDATADREKIKQAYRAKVKTSHPDAPNGDEETFKSVRRAYERLSAE